MNLPPLAGQSCTACGAATAPGRTLCAADAETLGALLYAVPDVVDDLEIAFTRGARIGEPSGRQSTEVPLPFSIPAAEALRELDRVLHAVEAVVLAPGRVPVTSTRLVAARLLARLNDVVGHPDAGYALDAVDVALRAARRVVDAPRDRDYAGPCWAPTNEGPCPVDLYAAHGSAWVVCRACSTRHDVAKRREFLLEASVDQLRNATMLARAVTGIGRGVPGTEVTPARIWKWAERGRLVAHGVDTAGRPTYRVGDVLDILQADLRAKIERDARRSA